MAKLSENAIKVLNFLLDQPEGTKVFSSEISTALCPFAVEDVARFNRSIVGTLNGLVKKGLVVSESHEDISIPQKLYYATEAATKVAENDFDYVK